MTNLELVRSVFIPDWTVLREGWLGYRLVTSEEIVAYALEVFSNSEAEPSPGVASLAFADPNDWEMLTLWMSELASSDPEAIQTARRKWRVILLQKYLADLSDDPLYGLLELGDFWAEQDFPEDSPHIFQGVGNTLTPQEYYTAATFQDILTRHRRWLDIEIAVLGGMDARSFDAPRSV